MDAIFPRSRSLAPVRALAALALAALPAACGYTAPQVTVVSADAVERTPDGFAMVIALDARNDNEVALPLRNVDYTVELDGRRVFVGTRSAEATLRRLGSQRFTLPAVVDLASDSGRLSGPARIRIRGSLQYVTPGQLAEVLFDAGVRVPSVAFSGEAEINLDKAKVITPATEQPLQSIVPSESAPEARAPGPA